MHFCLTQIYKKKKRKQPYNSKVISTMCDLVLCPTHIQLLTISSLKQLHHLTEGSLTKPLHPIFTAWIVALQSASLHFNASLEYLSHLNLLAAGIPSSQGTVSSMVDILRADEDHKSQSDLSVFSVISGGKTSFLPRSALISHASHWPCSSPEAQPASAAPACVSTCSVVVRLLLPQSWAEPGECTKRLSNWWLCVLPPCLRPWLNLGHSLDVKAVLFCLCDLLHHH